MKKIFFCQKCDAQYQKWMGKCEECGSWGTIITADNLDNTGESASLLTSEDISLKNYKKIPTHFTEIDNILKGGLNPDSLILLSGEPGIGKSTLLLQIISNINQDSIYVCGEESAEQVYSRAKRLKIKTKHLKFLPTTNLQQIQALAKKHKPKFLIIDSIQTLYNPEINSEPGNLAQIRSATAYLMQTAKQEKITVIITSQVNKEGLIAGPKTLEHMVDTVLHLEGDRTHRFRILRVLKNRFGSTNDIAVLEMSNNGLKEITNPSSIFLSEEHTFPGSVITTIEEGNKIFFIEIQALVNKTIFGYPQRKASGIDQNRLQLLLAVLQKHINSALNNYDIHINVVGGYKIKDPSADFAVCAAILSAWQNKIIPAKTIIAGEVGLGAEIRYISALDKRVAEAEKQGYKQFLGPSYKFPQKPKITYQIIKSLQNFAKATNKI